MASSRTSASSTAALQEHRPASRSRTSRSGSWTMASMRRRSRSPSPAPSWSSRPRASRKEELDRFCDAMIAIREEIRAIEEGRADRANNVLKRAPHTLAQIVANEWNRPYGREAAAFPAPWTRGTSSGPLSAASMRRLGIGRWCAAARQSRHTRWVAPSRRPPRWREGRRAGPRSERVEWAAIGRPETPAMPRMRCSMPRYARLVCVPRHPSSGAWQARRRGHADRSGDALIGCVTYHQRPL